MRDSKKMELRLIPYRFFGADRKEIGASLVIAAMGFFWAFSIFPPLLLESDGPNHFYIYSHAFNLAEQVAFVLTSLLCAMNAFRDKRNNEDQKMMIEMWCLILSAWLCASLWGLSFWITSINTSV